MSELKSIQKIPRANLPDVLEETPLQYCEVEGGFYLEFAGVVDVETMLSVAQFIGTPETK